MRHITTSRLLVVASLVLTLAAWHIASALAGETQNGAPLVPSLPDILSSIQMLSPYWIGGLGVAAVAEGGNYTFQAGALSLVYNTAVTAFHLACGTIVGVSAGIGLGVAISWSKTLRTVFEIPSHFARMLPLLAMVPLFALWFGTTTQEAILFVAFMSFVLMYPIAVHAIGNVPGYYSQYATSLGASRLRTYFTVVLPASLPELRSGVLLVVALGWSGAIAAEYLGHEHGLGSIAQNAQFFGNTEVLGVVGAVALLLGVVSFGAVQALLAWMVRWD